jgi:hypothetical protein
MSSGWLLQEVVISETVPRYFMLCNRNEYEAICLFIHIFGG